MHSPIASASWKKTVVAENCDRKLPEKNTPSCWTRVWAIVVSVAILFFIPDMIATECCVCMEDTQKYIQAGDIFQLVSSQRFSVKLMVR